MVSYGTVAKSGPSQRRKSVCIKLMMKLDGAFLAPAWVFGVVYHLFETTWLVHIELTESTIAMPMTSFDPVDGRRWKELWQGGAIY